MTNNILITGGAGFIGSNFIEYFLSKYPQICLINLDLLTYAGDLDNLKNVSNHKNYIFIKGDICDKSLLESIFQEYQIDSVIHFAAESHVDNSIIFPDKFIQTNINGTFNLLDTAYKFWTSRKNPSNQNLFYHISTDEVYGSLGKTGQFKEDSPYLPNSPYSASKAASDMLVRSYHHTYNLRIALSNCSNNYGPKQHQEKLIPTIIKKALCGEAIPIYGDGKNIRDWLYVTDHACAIEKIFFYALKNESGYTHFNIGGKNEIKNIDIAKYICSKLDELYPKNKSYAEQITFTQDRLGHDRRYNIDSGKIEKTLGFFPKESFESGIAKTIQWYSEKYFSTQRKPNP